MKKYRIVFSDEVFFEVSPSSPAYYDGYILFEVEPSVRTVMVGYRYDNDSHNDQYFRLSFPYIVFGLRYRRYFGKNIYHRLCALVSFGNEPYYDKYKPFGISYLPNTHASVSLCCNYKKGGPTLLNFIEDFIKNFWSSRFLVYDYDPDSYQLSHRDIPTGIKSIPDWAERTRIDPNFILKMHWPTPKLDKALEKPKNLNSVVEFYKRIRRH